jgi:hypothetical protein
MRTPSQEDESEDSNQEGTRGESPPVSQDRPPRSDGSGRNGAGIRGLARRGINGERRRHIGARGRSGIWGGDGRCPLDVRDEPIPALRDRLDVRRFPRLIPKQLPELSHASDDARFGDITIRPAVCPWTPPAPGAAPGTREDPSTGGASAGRLRRHSDGSGWVLRASCQHGNPWAPGHETAANRAR